MKEKRKHIEWIDFARSIAIICVVICHATEAVYRLNYEGMQKLSEQSKIFALTAFTIGRTGVPIFIFISGYLLLIRQYDDEKCIKFWKNNLLPLLLTAEVWIVLYNIFSCIFNKTSLDFQELIKNMLFVKRISFGHFWYIPMVIGIYIFIPFVANAINRFSTRVIIYPLIISVIYAFVIGNINIILNAKGLPKLNIVLSVEFSGMVYGIYFIVGYLFHRERFLKINKNVYKFGFIIIFLVTVLFQYYMYTKYKGFNVWYDFSLLLVYTTCLWGVIVNLKKIRFYSLFKLIAKYSFGIYLVHFPIQMMLQRYAKFNIMMPLGVILLASVTFLISLLIVYIVSKVPKLNKMLFLIK